jgi:hypothetical protein
MFCEILSTYISFRTYRNQQIIGIFYAYPWVTLDL